MRSSGTLPIGTRGGMRSQPVWLVAVQGAPWMTDTDASVRVIAYTRRGVASTATAAVSRPVRMAGQGWSHRLVSSPLQWRVSTTDTLPDAVSANAELAT